MTAPFADILIVEDSDEDAELIGRALRKARMLNSLQRVRDGQEALDYLFRASAYLNREAGDPSLVLLDLKLPRIDGLSVLRRIRAHQATRDIPVIVLTSSLEEQHLIQSYRLGALGYLIKPVAFSAFVEVVAQVGLQWAVVSQAKSDFLF